MDDLSDRIRSAWVERNPEPPDDGAYRAEWTIWAKARNRLEALFEWGAYESAVIQFLVPDDAFYRVGHDGEGPDPSMFRADLLQTPGFGKRVARADTPAEALLTAILEAANVDR